MSDLTRIIKAHGMEACIRSWNELVPPDTPCTVNGVATKTDTYAGRSGEGRHAVPCVFVTGIEEPVPLSQVQVDGVVQESSRVKRKER